MIYVFIRSLVSTIAGHNHNYNKITCVDMSTVHDHVQLNNKNKTNNNVEKMLCPENKTLKLNNEWLWRTV